MAKLVWLGRLADLAGAPESEFDGDDWPAVLAAVPRPLAAEIAGARVRVALNGAVVADKAALSIGAEDELAFLPPVSGG
jgi:sulfur-carrier protein